MARKFNDKMSFDLEHEMKLDIYEEADKIRMSGSELVRTGVKSLYYKSCLFMCFYKFILLCIMTNYTFNFVLNVI